MIRNLALAVTLALTLVGIGALSGPPVVQAVPLANNCLDPRHDNAVSVWSWTANNSTSGRFSLIQSNTDENNEALSNTMDVIAIAGLLNKDWSGSVFGLGNNITMIANGAATSNFLLTSAKRSGEAAFTGFALGDGGFVRFNAVLLACYDNSLKNVSFEAPDGTSTTKPFGWTENGNTANSTWIRSTGREEPPLDRLSGNSSLESQTTRNPCGTASRGYWESDIIGVTPGHEYMLGSFSRGTTAASTAVIQITTYIFSVFEGDFEAVTRTSQNWGLKTGTIAVPAFVDGARVSLKAEVACTTPPITGTAHFDDVFLIDVTGTTIRPQDSAE